MKIVEMKGEKQKMRRTAKPRTVTCAICGKTFTTNGKASRAKYCPDCRPAAYMELYRRSSERYREAHRKPR